MAFAIFMIIVCILFWGFWIVYGSLVAIYAVKVFRRKCREHDERYGKGKRKLPVNNVPQTINNILVVFPPVPSDYDDQGYARYVANRRAQLPS